MELKELASLNSEAYVLRSQMDRASAELSNLKAQQVADEKDIDRLTQLQEAVKVRAQKIAGAEKALADKEAELKTRLDILEKNGVSLPVLAAGRTVRL